MQKILYSSSLFILDKFSSNLYKTLMMDRKLKNIREACIIGV